MTLTEFPGTNRIMMIKKAAFVASAIRDIPIFRLPHRAMPTYVNDLFRERAEAAGLHGLDFNEVWSGRA